MKRLIFSMKRLNILFLIRNHLTNKWVRDVSALCSYKDNSRLRSRSWFKYFERMQIYQTQSYSLNSREVGRTIPVVWSISVQFLTWNVSVFPGFCWYLLRSIQIFSIFSTSTSLKSVDNKLQTNKRITPADPKDWRQPINNRDVSLLCTVFVVHSVYLVPTCFIDQINHFAFEYTDLEWWIAWYSNDHSFICSIICLLSSLFIILHSHRSKLVQFLMKEREKKC